MSKDKIGNMGTEVGIINNEIEKDSNGGTKEDDIKETERIEDDDE